MDSIRLFLLLGIGLSMDTFSLSIVYGTNNISMKKKIILSLIVGIFHFLMPFVSSTLTKAITNNFITNINTNLLSGIILLVLGVEMILNLANEEEVKELNIFSIILFAFTVSIDSFSIGIALTLQKENIILGGIVFALCSFIFTFIGLLIGKKLKDRFNNKINVIGAFILIAIALNYIIKTF